MLKVYVCICDIPYEGYCAPDMVTLDKAKADEWLASKPTKSYEQYEILKYTLDSEY